LNQLLLLLHCIRDDASAVPGSLWPSTGVCPCVLLSRTSAVWYCAMGHAIARASFAIIIIVLWSSSVFLVVKTLFVTAIIIIFFFIVVVFVAIILHGRIVPTVFILLA
jgi:hypothetical protein